MLSKFNNVICAGIDWMMSRYLVYKSLMKINSVIEGIKWQDRDEGM